MVTFTTRRHILIVLGDKPDTELPSSMTFPRYQDLQHSQRDDNGNYSGFMYADDYKTSDTHRRNDVNLEMMDFAPHTLYFCIHLF